MNRWTADELSRIAAADELRVAPLRPDGKRRSPVTIWVVRQGDDLFVRSYRGSAGRWYRSTRSGHRGHIKSGGVDKDVSFVDVTDDAVNAEIDQAYLAKYHKYEASFVDPMLTADARATTMKLVPR